MPVRVSPQDATSRWVSQLSASGTKITAGVNAVTTSPGIKAAAHHNKWVAAMADPHTQQKWRTNVAKMPLETWKSLMLEVGIPRISSGAQAKQGKYLAFAEHFFPFLTRVVAQVDNMDSSNFAARVQKAVQLMTLLHNYQPGA